MDCAETEDFALNELFQFEEELVEEHEKISYDGEEASTESNCSNMQLQSNDSPEIVKEVSVSQDSTSNDSNYFYLLEMFPDVNPEYIREICIKPPFDKIDGNLTNMLVNHLLGYEDKSDISFDNDMFVNKEVHQNDLLETEIFATLIEEDKINESIKNDKILSEMLEIQEIEAMEEEEMNKQLFCEFLKQDQELIEQKAKIIEKILPDIDPDYLRQFIKENHQNSESLEEFVDSKLFNKDYKKRGEHFAQKKKMENIQQYITCFDVVEFIRLFPEPVEYFEDKERKCAKHQKALNFLLDRYSSHSRQYIENVYTLNLYNLSLADKHLNNISQIEPIIQLNIDLDDVPLLQEIAFIQNKTLIKDYLKNLKEEEERELRILRAQKLLLECQCCYDEMKPTDCIECDSEHIFCKNCIIKGTKFAISNGKPYVHCFKDSCKNEFTLSILRQVLPQNTFDTFLRKRQELEVFNAKVEDLQTCPFCEYQAIVPPQVQIFTCENPECMKITCRKCKKINHLPIECQNVLDEHKSRLFLEEELSDVIIRRCYKCNTPFVKLEGCNKMTCYKCKAIMCYICKQPITDYNHFEQGTSCRTHQNSDLFDREQIELKRAEATTKLRKDFPDLKIPDV